MDTLKKPKRRNAPRTKAKILTAAQKSFSEHGYAQVGIRDIATIADVSSPLLLRYFGSKAGLFEAALIDAMRMDALFELGRDHFGEHLTRLFLDPDLDIKPPSLVALSIGDADAREIATRVTEEHVLTPLAKWLGPPDARVRALEIILLSMGFVLYTRQLPLMSVTKGVDKKMAKWFAQTVQAIVDQS
jgi:AcrR family transcriptional regulator